MKFEIIFFDCDGVLVFDNLWENLHNEIGMPHQLDRNWFDDYYAGKIKYQDWINNLENYYKKKQLNQTIFERSLSKFSINPEALELINHVKKNNLKIAIISSGIDYYVKKIALELDIQDWRANNSLQFNKNGKFRKLTYQTRDQVAKVVHVKEVCLKHSISPKRAIFIGDSINDLEAFKYTKHGILYKPGDKPYKDIAWKTVDDLREIKKYI
ncbi:HAD family hydrolase [Patescibacteria group bacterium]